MPTIDVIDADKHECPFNNFSPCRGPRCMAWLWSGAAFEGAETDNLHDTDDGLRPIGVPPAPDGEDWNAEGPPFRKGYYRSDKDKLPQATAQRWIRRRRQQRGFCSRSGADRFGDDF